VCNAVFAVLHTGVRIWKVTVCAKEWPTAVCGKCMRERAGNLIPSRIVIFEATIFLPSRDSLKAAVTVTFSEI
jgi:hypothetical protein